jgi:hypothetical protein
MGLFTQEAKTDYNVPVELRMAEDAAKSQRKFTDTYLDPAIKENIGYESPRMKMKALTSGVDLTDGKAVQKVFMELQAMDPQEANGWLQSIKPVIAQHLDSIKIKDASLKSDILANKGNVNAQWTGLAMPQYIAAKTKELFEIHGVEGAGVPTLELFRSRLKDLGLEKADANRVYQDLAKALEAEEKAWKIRNQTRDFTGKTGVAEPDANTSNAFSDPATNSDSITSNILGSSGTPGISQINTEASALDTLITDPKSKASSDLRDKLKATFQVIDNSGLKKSEFNMSKKELTNENKLDALRDWLGNGNVTTSAAQRYFTANPKEFANFEKKPLLWFFTKIRPADKTDYSAYSIIGN